jgi:hypothetical protein
MLQDLTILFRSPQPVLDGSGHVNRNQARKSGAECTVEFETFDTFVAEADLQPRDIHLDRLQPGNVSKGRAAEIADWAPGRELMVAEQPSRNTVLPRWSPVLGHYWS